VVLNSHDDVVDYITKFGGATYTAPVIRSDLPSPPGSPSDGDRYIVPVGGLGAWGSHDKEIAQYSTFLGDWIFTAPVTGLRAYDVLAGRDKRYNGSGWVFADPTLVQEWVTPTLGQTVVALGNAPLSAEALTVLIRGVGLQKNPDDYTLVGANVTLGTAGDGTTEYLFWYWY
jgi:hypothetical protein